MKDQESDAWRLKKLLKNYKHEKFKISSHEDTIECAGINIKCALIKRNGLRVVEYIVSVDGRPLILNEKMRNDVRDVYNRVYYCEPDDTPLRERLLYVSGYAAVCIALFALIIWTRGAYENSHDKNAPVVARTVTEKKSDKTLTRKSFNNVCVVWFDHPYSK